ncbi:hypothetical protein DCC85_05610 [Paenibacillus sp. CAA11]|uniref:hypothetical protein n=1 Tax=Paenibacillus sp. CAA11 TaxID=1532905 RepID=UPI000D39E0CE|nr:hypothetical protein [Paenibacillus sp. CAA11]AWB43747.1 hypothetical protein DCC85_05610 [Paenibacillus sp. CAA11]
MLNRKQKWTAALLLTTALTVPATTAFFLPQADAAGTAPAKTSIQLSEGISYYGEVQNNKPNGRGTIHWGEHKQYAGEFKDGKRSGMGKYINEYVDADGRTHKIVYNGTWNNDLMNGSGTLTEKRTEANGTVIYHSIQTGTFKNGAFQTGYYVQHAEADPDYAFTYKNGGETLYIMGSNQDLLPLWKKGQLFNVIYQKGSIYKEYWMFPEEDAAKERQRKASIKYLQGITAKVKPHLEQFEKLSKQVPLK